MAMDARRFDLIAETQILIDGEVAHCWELVRAGIQRRLIDPDNLRGLIDRLRDGEAVSLGELTVEREAGGERLALTLEDDRRTCPATVMLDELERLARRAGASSAAASASTASTSPASPASAAASPPSTTASSTTAPPPPSAESEAAAAMAPELLTLLAGLLGTTPARLASDPSAHRARLERVQAALARWRAVAADPAAPLSARAAAESELRAALATTGDPTAATSSSSNDNDATAATSEIHDLDAALRALGLDPAALGGVSGTITDWLEQRTPAAGAAVDRLIAALEASLFPLLGRPTPAEVDAERDRRLREEARASIAASVAARLKLPRP